MNVVKKFMVGLKLSKMNIKQLITKKECGELSIKKHIGKLAAAHIETNDIIYIDTGTTTIHVLDYVDKNYHLQLLLTVLIS